MRSIKTGSAALGHGPLRPVGHLRRSYATATNQAPLLVRPNRAQSCRGPTPVVCKQRSRDEVVQESMGSIEEPQQAPLRRLAVTGRAAPG